MLIGRIAHGPCFAVWPQPPGASCYRAGIVGQEQAPLGWQAEDGRADYSEARSPPPSPKSALFEEILFLREAERIRGSRSL